MYQVNCDSVIQLNFHTNQRGASVLSVVTLYI